MLDDDLDFLWGLIKVTAWTLVVWAALTVGIGLVVKAASIALDYLGITRT